MSNKRSVSSVPLQSIGIGAVPSNLVDGDSSPFNQFFSDTALCRECYEVFVMTLVLDSKCPFCGAYVDLNNLVVSDRGYDASRKRAIELSRRLKESRKTHIIRDEDIYDDGEM